MVSFEEKNDLKDFISGFSIEVLPKSASKIESFTEILPKQTRVYIAHLADEDISAMVATAKRLSDERASQSCHIFQLELYKIVSCFMIGFQCIKMKLE